MPEYIEMVTAWCKHYSKLPVIVKLTPNITDIRYPARAAKAGGADAVELINTINSIMGVDLDRMAMSPSTDGRGSHGGYCGPAVKPIALNMVAEIARDAQTRGLPISGIGGITTWRDAAEFIALGCGNVQVCTAAMVYGFKIVQGPVPTACRTTWTSRATARSRTSAAGPSSTVTDWKQLNLNHVEKAVINQDTCIQCGRCHIVCEDTSHQAITATEDGKRHFEVKEEECVGCNLCVSVCPVPDMHHDARAAARRGRPAHRRRGERRVRQLDHAPEQSDARQRRDLRLKASARTRLPTRESADEYTYESKCERALERGSRTHHRGPAHLALVSLRRALGRAW